MSKLHIIFGLSVDIFNKQNQLVDNITIPIDINSTNTKVDIEKLDE